MQIVTIKTMVISVSVYRTSNMFSKLARILYPTVTSECFGLCCETENNTGTVRIA